MKKSSDLFLMIVVLGTLLLFSFSGSLKYDINHSDKENNNFKVPDTMFHSGDLIFRDGRGVISSTFRMLSLTDSKYSHAGIIHVENGQAYVFHVIGGEQNLRGEMRKDLLSDFCSNLQANSFAIYRTDQDGRKIDSLAQYYYHIKLKFDSNFDLSTDDKMYCTELLYKILTKVSNEDNFLPLTSLKGIKYSACDNIYLSPHAKKIFTYEYSR